MSYSWRFVSSYIADLLLRRNGLDKLHKNSNHPYYCRYCRFIFLSIAIRSSEVSTWALYCLLSVVFGLFTSRTWLISRKDVFRVASQVVVDDATDPSFVAGMLEDVSESLHLPLLLLKQWNCVHPQHDRMNAASWKSCTALFNRCSLIAFSN